MTQQAVALEFAVQSAEGARVAKQVGADRVELCSALGATGGLTPSMALVRQVVMVGLPVQVLIRCRPGPFVYDADEVAVMVQDASLAIRLGAAGVVFGALTSENAIDTEAMARVRDAARGVDPEAQVTCHRAFDVLIAQRRAELSLDKLIGLGCTRVLTSGGAARSIDGAPVLAELVAQAAGRLQIQAGGGVRPDDVAALAASGVDAVHMSASATRPIPGASAGPGGGTTDTIEYTDPGLAQAYADAVRALALVTPSSSPEPPADAVSTPEDGDGHLSAD